MRSVFIILSVVAVLYAGACVALYFNQRGLVYFPHREVGAHMTLKVDGADLAVAVREHAGPKAIIYFGGNAEDVSGSLPELASAFPDHALYLLHYRGYGASTGKPAEEALHADARALYGHVMRTHSQVAVIGRSLGSGVAVRLAAERPVTHLVLVTPYDSIATIAERQFSWFPVRWILTEKFESWRHAPKVRVPTLLLRAEQDEVIPRDSTERLFGRFENGVAKMVVVPGAGHNTISESPRYMAEIQSLLVK
jgi:uncharacterized protein